MLVPFERCYWVEPGQLLAGSYPGSKRFDEAGRRLNALLDAGIRTIINLMEEDETDWHGDKFEPYEETIRILAENRGLDVECLRIPVQDVNVLSSIVMKSILCLQKLCPSRVSERIGFNPASNFIVASTYHHG
jgi:hypothetical protein